MTLDVSNGVAQFRSPAAGRDDPKFWDRLARKVDSENPDLIVLGFDGSKGRSRGQADSTALAGLRLADRRLHTVEVWEQPAGVADWEPPRDEIDRLVDDLFASGLVVGMRADPAGGWADTISEWQNRYKPVLWSSFPISIGNWTPQAFDLLYDAIDAERVTVDEGDVPMRQHLLAARNRGATVGKEHSGPAAQKMDLAAAAAYAYRALTDALAARPARRKTNKTANPF